MANADITMPSNIQMVPIEKIIPYARNARLHSADQIKQIAASIREFGFRDPVELASDYTIVAGHGRVEALALLGGTMVPCIIHADMDKSQWRAYNLVNNRLTDNSTWDLELLKTEITDLKFDFDFKEMGFDTNAALFTDTENLSGETKDYKGSKELDESEFSEFDHKCPSCGFEFD